MRAMICACVVVSLAVLGSACQALDDVEAGFHRSMNPPGNAAHEPSDGATDEPIDGATDESAGVTPAPSSAPASAPVVAAPVISVTLGVKVYSLVVGGTSSVRADFNWSAVGSKAARVTVQMKSSQSMTWTDILPNQPAADVGSYQLPTYVQQSFWFRAVAVDPAFPDAGATSEITFVQ